MASAWIARETRPGRAKTYRVRHRLGGGESARLDGGSFPQLARGAALGDQAGALGLQAPEGRHRQLAVKADHERAVEGQAQRVGRHRAGQARAPVPAHLGQ